MRRIIACLVVAPIAVVVLALAFVGGFVLVEGDRRRARAGRR